MRTSHLRSGAGWLLLLIATVCYSDGRGAEGKSQERVTEAKTPAPARSAYVLGPDDQITIRGLDIEEIGEKPILIDSRGYIRLPLVGSIEAAGLTTQELEAKLVGRLKIYIKNPEVAVSVTTRRNLPVSVMGAVNAPGVFQLHGSTTLFEVLSMAGGIKGDAGPTVKVMRRKEVGPLPLSGASEDPSGQFTVAEVNVKDVMEARKPEANIPMRPNDVVTVSKARMIYVIGEVRKAGGFVLNEPESVSVLQALSLAEGLTVTAIAKNARILRDKPGADQRVEIAVNLKSILGGKAPDVAMQPNDILFVPNNVVRETVIKSLQTMVQLGTGMVIYRR